MTLLQFWPLIEIAFIVAAFSLILFRIWRGMKERARSPQSPPGTQPRAKHILRLVGFFAGTFAALVLFLSVERTIVAVFKETAPTPSQVSVPADLEFEVEEIAFESEDGLTIAGWYVPPKNGAVIILLHGYGGNRTGTLWYARQLIPAGYGVLMYDERASGESEGTYRSYGWEDTRDVDAALNFLASRPDPMWIAILGCSTGADIALRSAAAFPEIAAVWADGASSVRAQDLPQPSNPIVALIVASNYALDWLYVVKLDIEPPAPLIEALPSISPRPILLVGGGSPRPLIGREADLFTLRYASLAGPNAEAWIIPEATHCDGPRRRPEEYAEKMIAFFDEAFGLGD